MSRQRNEPNDILSEVMEYDEEKAIAGTSKDDKGDETATVFPEHMPPESLDTDLQREIWQKWAMSQYQNLSGNNLTEFANKHDFNFNPVRKVVMRGAKSKRSKENLTEAERLAIAIFAYEGNEKTFAELGEKYPISDTTLSRVSFSFPDIIKKYSEREITTTEINDAVKHYKKSSSFKQKGPEEKAENELWPQIKTYLKNNAGATVRDADKELNLGLSTSQLHSYKANAGKLNLSSQSNNNNVKAEDEEQNINQNKNKETNPDQSKNDGMSITLFFDSDEALELINGDTEPFDVRKRVVEKVVQKAFE